MSLRAQAVKNVTATWFALFVQAAVGFFLSPFILQHLGDEAFSMWVLVFAVTGYFGLLDFGIRSSIVKYTAKFTATCESEELSRYLSTSFAFYGLVSIAVLISTGIIFFRLDTLFHIPASTLETARMLFLLAGIGVALTFPLGVFAGALEGLQKFAWLQLSQVVVALVRAGLVVVALETGRGLVTIGAISVILSVLSYVVFAGMALRLLPTRLSLRNVEGVAFRRMASYGFFALAILGAEKLRFQSDALVIGVSLSATAITSFSIGARLTEYASYAVRSMSQIFTPMSSQFHATGDIQRLQRTFIAGNRACALVTFPLCILLVVLGKVIIESWVGVRYLSSYPILLLLIIPRSLYLAQSSSIRILLGMGRHRVLASILVGEGVANLLLSVLLVRRFGVIGVALGTAIPLACTSLFFLPWHLCKVLDLPLSRSLKQSYGMPLALCAPMTGLLVVLSNEFSVHNYGGLMLQVAVGALAYCIPLAGVLFSDSKRPRSWQVLSHLLEPK
ncbi:MAG TPA: polysaccharide biosynthesis C-terminal domain-containing protein [Candidatus Solibacter sp.]|nr:polysaccharide biosynthesis C-terminal domain-containing protein [Candidatus Solibacter sp.]